MSSTKAYQVTVNRTLKNGSVSQKTYTKYYHVMSEEDKLNKQKTCRNAKIKLLADIRKKLKEFENDYDILVNILRGLNSLLDGGGKTHNHSVEIAEHVVTDGVL